jgi:hypothetical protein
MNFTGWCRSPGLRALAGRLLQLSPSASNPLMDFPAAFNAVVAAAPLDQAAAALRARLLVQSATDEDLLLLVALATRVGGPAALANLWLKAPATRSLVLPALLHALEQSRGSSTVLLAEAWAVCSDAKVVTACWDRLLGLAQRLSSGQKGLNAPAALNDASCLGVLVHAARRNRESRRQVASLLLLSLQIGTLQDDDAAEAEALVFLALPLIREVVAAGDAPAALASLALHSVLHLLLARDQTPWLNKKVVAVAWREASCGFAAYEGDVAAFSSAALDSLSVCLACVEALAAAVVGSANPKEGQLLPELVVNCLLENDKEDQEEEEESEDMDDADEKEESTEKGGNKEMEEGGRSGREC